jgi:hypothetical protein
MLNRRRNLFPLFFLFVKHKDAMMRLAAPFSLAFDLAVVVRFSGLSLFSPFFGMVWQFGVFFIHDCKPPFRQLQYRFE